MIEEDPRLVEDQQGRPPVEPLLQPVEQIGEHRRDHARLAEQRLGLKALHVGEGQPALGRIEQPAVRPVERKRLDRRAERVGLEQQRQPGHRPLLRRRRCEAAERRPHHLLDLGRDHDLLARE